MRYKVLWIDDEYKKQADFIGEAEQDDIDIIAYESHEEGIAHLNNNLDYIHAVILDAKVKNKKDDVVTDLTGLTASRDRLIEINKDRYLPYFVFTGQPDYHTNEMFKQSFGDYYIKAKDNEQLFIDLKKAVEEKVEYQIQKKYENVFQVCTDKYLGQTAGKDLMKILRNLEQPNEEFNDEKYFNCLRKIVEYVFRASNKLGLLHDKCIPGGQVNLTWASLFMSGKYFNEGSSGEKVGCEKSHFSNTLSRNVQTLLDITNSASHTNTEGESTKLDYHAYKENINSNFLLYSLTFQVMDLMLWFKVYADKNPDIVKNKLLWETFDPADERYDWIKGRVSRIAENGFGTFKPDRDNSTLGIIPLLMKEHSLAIDNLIEVQTHPSPDGTKTYIKELRKLT